MVPMSHKQQCRFPRAITGVVNIVLTFHESLVRQSVSLQITSNWIHHHSTRFPRKFSVSRANCPLTLPRIAYTPRIPRRRPANLTNIKCISCTAHVRRFSERTGIGSLEEPLLLWGTIWNIRIQGYFYTSTEHNLLGAGSRAQVEQSFLWDQPSNLKKNFTSA